MAFMVYVGVAAVGFLAGYLFELAWLKRVPGARPALWTASLGLLGYALVMVCIRSTRFDLPGWVGGVGWGLLLTTSALLVYSLFLEPPFARTYLHNSPRHSLVQTGTYALVRHPAMVWYVLLLIALVLISRSVILLTTLPVWVLLEGLWVILQEQMVLSRLFPDYVQYRQKTPMFIPTWRSTRASLKSLAFPWAKRPSSLEVVR